MSEPDPKICFSCGREMVWRKKWERSWDEVRHCSAACRRRWVRQVDRELEAAIVRRLQAERRVVITQGGRVVDPSTAKGPIRIRRS